MIAPYIPRYFYFAYLTVKYVPCLHVERLSFFQKENNLFFNYLYVFVFETVAYIVGTRLTTCILVY